VNPVAVAILVLAFFLAPHQLAAKEAVPTELDRVQQKRAVELSEHLRCLVCQNQTIADSNAELAQDLRRQVREQIAQGRSDPEIIGFMVQRYGDFVLYKPPVKHTTLLLWFGPGLLLLIGIGVLVRNVRVRRRVEPVLNAEERTRAHELLLDVPEKDRP
jgi:cytochrome c-type biogenesis protein CcmH